MRPPPVEPQGAGLIVFDWDGTVVDSIASIAESIRLAAADLGLPVPTEQEARHVIGLGLSDALRLAVQQGLEICRGHDAIRGEFCEVFYRPRKYARQKSCIEYHKDHPDQVAATRRAIVRAAAEIGKVQP